MPDHLTRTAFEPYLNTTFRMPFEDTDDLNLELVEATDKTPEGFDGEQFSLIFKGPADIYLPQQVYHLEHPDLGPLSLFLVPVDQKDDGYRYEAFFNLAADTEA